MSYYTFKHKALVTLLAVGLILPPSLPPLLQPIDVTAHSSKPSYFIKPQVKKGIVSVRATKLPKGKSFYVMIEKGKQDYSFKLTKTENIPLPFGNGVYKVTLFVGDGTNFKKVQSIQFKASFSTIIASKQKTILSPGTSNAEVKKILSVNMKGWQNWSTEKRVKKVHEYITKNYRYDYTKSDNLTDWYLPPIHSVIKNKKGICYDFSSLTSSLLREMGVPTRIVLGYSNQVPDYHSWNEVYVNKQWKIIDTTYDLGSKKKNIYQSSKQYQDISYRF